uniref:Uncharacterized protein n=1 Tax=Glaucocystis sp. BBH TaxID=2023628 RepID=A0A3G1IV60_9EUKA|nr:hypothetical protein [Glaucocystis sp. BBH]
MARKSNLFSISFRRKNFSLSFSSIKSKNWFLKLSKNFWKKIVLLKNLYRCSKHKIWIFKCSTLHT